MEAAQIVVAVDLEDGEEPVEVFGGGAGGAAFPFADGVLLDADGDRDFVLGEVLLLATFAKKVAEFCSCW